MNKKHIALIVVFLLAAILRFWQLGSNPPSLTWDEVAWGYNAYSIGIDGKDEFGKFLPIQYLESFGDFKPPMYAYLAVLPVKIFGLTEFAVRFPSALFGTLTVVLTYFLVKRIFDSNLKSPIKILKNFQGKQISNLKNTTQNSKSEWIALLSTLFLAISPWHINLSRAAFEANVATFFLVTGVWAFLVGISEKRRFLILSAIAFVLSLYTFNTSRIVAPILVLVLAWGFRKKLFERKKEVFVAATIGILLVAPLFRFLLSPEARLRFEEVNIFSDLGVIERTNQEIENDKNAFWSKIIHNRRVVFATEYVKHYLDHFSPQFLFVKGDGNPKFSTQDVGQLYFWELPFLIAGILFLFRKREGYWWIIPLWLLVGIIPAATARETPHALRIETTLPTFQIIVAYGVLHVWHAISNIKYKISNIQMKYSIFAMCFLFLIFNFLYYLHGYYAHYPREYSGEWQFGYKESITVVESLKNDFDQVNVTTALGRPYIYYLFYTKTHPQEFQKTAKIWRDSYGFTHVDGFNMYRFGDDLGKLDNDDKRILYVNAVDRAPKKSNVFKTINLLNGDPALTVYEVVFVHEEQ